MIRLGIIEDDTMIRTSLCRYFSDEPGFECLLDADSVESFFEQWHANLFFDIILSDIGLPGESGIQGIGRIRKKAPKCNVMMLTVYSDSNRIFQALCAGATGYLLKQTPFPKIKEAIIALGEGGSPMSPGIARKVVEYFNPRSKENGLEKLTDREAQVVQAIGEGLTNKEVAIRMDIAVQTVKVHIKNIYQKLEVNSRHAIIKGNYR